MIALSTITKHHMLTLFGADASSEAEHLLVHDCAENLHLGNRDTMLAELERIRLAALRVSGGDLERLREAVALARVDWRDLLVAAGFADDSNAHKTWQPRGLMDP